MNDERTTAASAQEPVAELCLDLFEHLDRGDDLAGLSSILLRIEALPTEDPQRPNLIQCAQRAMALCQRLEEYQHKERALRAVFENAQVLTELKELDSVLFDIVERGRKLLGSDMAWLAGEESGSVSVLAIDGANTEAARHMHGPATSGIAGYVAGTRSPFTTHDYLNDPKFAHESSIDEAIRNEGLQSVIAVPIQSEASVIGVLIVADRYKRSYHAWEVSILATLAAHASVAIRNARTFELKQDALKDSESANRRLEEKITTLHQAAEAHDRLSRQLARGGSMQQMLEVIADILGARATFLDPAGVALFSAFPPDLEMEPDPDEAGAKARFYRMAAASSERSRLIGRSVPVDDTAESGAQVMAVSSGEDYLGCLLVEANPPLQEHGIRIFERCSTAMAVLMLLAERRSASARQDADLTVRALLDEDQNPHDDVTERAKRHGLDTNGTILLFVAEVERAKLSYVARKIDERLRACPRMISELDGFIVALINRKDVAGCRREMEDTLFGELRASGIASLSAPQQGSGSLPHAYDSAKKVLSLSRKMGRTDRVVYEPELSMYAILFQKHNAEDLSRLLDANIGPLLAYDRRRGTSLGETLLAFLDHRQNARATARTLGIHVNTAHNRLETITDLIGPWDRDGRTVELHLALRLWEITKQGHPIAAQEQSHARR